MNKWLTVSVVSVALIGAAGCRPAPRPVPRVPVPQSYQDGNAKTYEPLRPIRPEPPQDPGAALPPPSFDDPPLVNEAVPEQAMYVDAYNAVGRPRLATFVNRTIEGDVIATDGRPAPLGPGGESYLNPGQYDETQARAIDYQAIELALSDALAAGGKVTLVSPMMARQRLSDEEVKDLQAGRPQVLRDVAEKLDADVLVQVQARPTKQTSEGLGVRILVEAVNTRGGESIARSFVDVPPPLDKPTINRYTRFLARKTMYELAGSWSAPPRREPATTQPR